MKIPSDKSIAEAFEQLYASECLDHKQAAVQRVGYYYIDDRVDELFEAFVYGVVHGIHLSKAKKS